MVLKDTQAQGVGKEISFQLIGSFNE